MLGKRLAQLRKEKKLTQRELSKELNISNSSLALYETEKRQPDYNTLNKLADYFDVSTDYLLGRTIVRKPVDTIAFHSLDDDDLTEEGKEELAKLRELVKLKYGKKKD